MKFKSLQLLLLLLICIGKASLFKHLKTKTPNNPFNLLTKEDLPFNSFEQGMSSPINLYLPYDGKKIESKKYVFISPYYIKNLKFKINL